MKTTYKLVHILVILALTIPVLPLAAAPMSVPPVSIITPGHKLLGPLPIVPHAPCVDCVAETDLQISYDWSVEGLVAPGELIKYSINVQHTSSSNAPARNIVITNTLPTSVTYVSQANTLGFTPIITTGGRVIWTRPLLNTDESATLDLWVRIATSPTVKPGDTLFNSVEITSSDLDIVNSNNSDTDSQGVVAALADVYVNKFTEPSWLSEAPQGEEIIYRLDFYNTGNITATDVVLTETLPSNTTFRGWSNSNNVDAPQHTLFGDITFTPTVLAPKIVWHLGDLAPGQWDSLYTLVYISNTVLIGTRLTNTAYIDTSAPEDITSNNWVEKSLTVYTATANVAMASKSVSWNSDDPTPGNDLQYSIQFEQIGSHNAPARDVIIVDTLPLSTTLTSWSSNASSQDHTLFDREITATVGLTQVMWHIGTLRPGRTTALYPLVHIPNSVPVSTMLTNTVYITTTSPDSTPGDHIATVATTVISPTPPGPDLSITKSRWSSNAPPPDVNIEYKLTFENQGDLAAHDVVITDTLPTTTTFVSWSNRPNYQTHAILGQEITPTTQNGQIVWPLGTVDVGENGDIYLTLHVSATATTDEVLTNTARIATSDTDTNETNNSDTQTDTVVDPTWDLTVDKRLNREDLVPGGEIEYRVYFKNQGNSPATNVVITDTLPNSDYITYKGEFDGNLSNPYLDLEGVITPTFSNGQLVWDLGTISESQYGYLYFYVVIADTAQPRDVLCNHAEVSTRELDNDPTNDVFTTTHTVQVPLWDMKVSKSLASVPGAPGGEMVYSLEFQNLGNMTAHNVVLTDTLPPSVTLDTWSTAKGNTYTMTQTGNHIVWDLGDQVANSSSSVDVTVHIPDSSSIGQVLTNKAEITTSAEEWHTANNIAILETAIVTQTRDVYISKSIVGGEEGAPGGEAKYHLEFGNQGNMPAQNVVVSDTLPPHMRFVSWSAYSGIISHELLDQTVTETVSGNQISWPLGTLEAGESDDIYLTVYVSDTAQIGERLTNTAHITTSDADINANNDTNLDQTQIVTPVVDLAINKFLNSAAGTPGGEMVYRLEVHNYGNVPADNVWITDTLPVSTTYAADYSAGFTTVMTDTGVVTNNIVAWTIPQLKNDRTVDLVLRIHIADTVSVTDILTNSVEITTTTGNDVDPSNNHSILATEIISPFIHLIISKYGPSEAGYGGLLDYSIYFYNTGNWPADGVAVTDTFPAHTAHYYDYGLLFDGSPETYSQTVTATTSTSQTVWQLGTLPASGWGYLHLIGRAQPEAQIGDYVTNTVVITNRSPEDDLSDNLSTWASEIVTPTPPSYVDITGPMSGTRAVSYTFKATVSPPTATMPISYEWQATGQTPLSQEDYSHSKATFTWSTTGTKTITVTARNYGGAVSNTHTITITQAVSCTPVSAVDLIRSDTGTIYTDTEVSLTANITPADTTKPYHYRSTVDGIAGDEMTSSTNPLVFTETFATTGTHTVLIAVWNCTMTESDAVTDVITVTAYAPGTCVNLDSVTIGGQSTGTPGTYTFTTTYLPTGATLPFSYTWDNGDTTETSIRNLSLGTHTLMVTMTNACSTVTDTHTIVITDAVVCPTPLTVAGIDGPNLVDSRTEYSFTAVITPAGATPPLTYLWDPAPLSGQGTSTATFKWPVAGFNTITLTVENCGGIFSDTHAILARGLGAELPATPSTEGMLIYTHTNGLTTTLEVPTGGVDEDVTLIYTPISSNTLPAPPTGLQFGKHTFDISAFRGIRLLSDFTFAKPVTLTIRYDDADILGLDEDTLVLHYWNGSAWVDAVNTCTPASTYYRDVVANILAVPICHLSRWGMLGSPISGTPTIYLPLVLRRSS